MKGSKKGACSSHTAKAKANALSHNRREGQIPSYVNQRLSHRNRTVFEHADIAGRKHLQPLIDAARKLYTLKTHQRCQDSFAPYRESVLVVRPDITDKQLMRFVRKVERLTGWTCMGVWIHLDEGHRRSKALEGDAKWSPNPHVHVLWRCQDLASGKAIAASRDKLRMMQDLLAEATGMERGNPATETGRQHRTAAEQRIIAQEQRLAELDQAANRQHGSSILRGLADLIGADRTLSDLRRERRRLKAQLADRERPLAEDQRLELEARIAELQTQIKAMVADERKAAKEASQRIAEAKAEGRAAERQNAAEAAKKAFTPQLRIADAAKDLYKAADWEEPVGTLRSAAHQQRPLTASEIGSIVAFCAALAVALAAPSPLAVCMLLVAIATEDVPAEHARLQTQLQGAFSPSDDITIRRGLGK